MLACMRGRFVVPARRARFNHKNTSSLTQQYTLLAVTETQTLTHARAHAHTHTFSNVVDTVVLKLRSEDLPGPSVRGGSRGSTAKKDLQSGSVIAYTVGVIGAFNKTLHHNDLAYCIVLIMC